MSVPPREIGTLIVVILKARNLPNKRHIGKQDPYCSVGLNGETRRTKAIKRGGQHPEWDEEIRFTLYEDPDTNVSLGSESEVPPTPSKKDSDAPNIQGGKFMKLACYAEYLRDPEFIGDAQVDLTEVLTKGETDEWFTLMNKGKYSGEVYLELTFWSNEPPPAKRSSSKPKVKKQYGGPGSFVPSDGPSSAPSTPPNGTVTPPKDSIGSRSSGLYSMSSGSLHEASSESVPSSLRASSSIVRRDLYTAPYETSRSQRSYHSVESLANDFAELGVQNDQGRSTAYMQPSISYTHPLPLDVQQSYYASTNHTESQQLYYDYQSPSSYSDETSQSGYEQNRPLTPGKPQGDSSLPPPPAPYQAPYGSSASASHMASNRTHGLRYSLPTSSSGFVPIATPAPSVFAPPQPSGYPPLQSAPVSVPFHTQPQYEQLLPASDPGPTSGSAPTAQGYAGYDTGYGQGYGQPQPPRTPVPSSSVPPTSSIYPSSSATIPSSSYQAMPPSTYYQQYVPAAYPPAAQTYMQPPGPPPHHLVDTLQSHSLPGPQGHPEHGGYVYPQASAPYPQAPPRPPSTLSQSTSSPHVSRPLPQPQPSTRMRRHSMVNGTPSQFSVNAGYSSFGHIPPPPPLPVKAASSNDVQVAYIPNAAGQQASVPPPPPLPSTVTQSQPPHPPSRQGSLNGYSHPLPPPLIQRQPSMHVPPPPSLPHSYYQPISVGPGLADGGLHPAHPGPLPRPPQFQPPPADPVQMSSIANVEWR